MPEEGTWIFLRQTKPQTSSSFYEKQFPAGVSYADWWSISSDGPAQQGGRGAHVGPEQTAARPRSFATTTGQLVNLHQET